MLEEWVFAYPNIASQGVTSLLKAKRNGPYYKLE